MIKLNKVCFSYDGEHPVLVDFCMEIPDGGAIAVMGASGSGKTTLLRILLGTMRFFMALSRPFSGSSRIAASLPNPLLANAIARASATLRHIPPESSLTEKSSNPFSSTSLSAVPAIL